VTATLSGFDRSLVRAAHSLGATPTTTFFRVVLPLVLPGVISGALFAFITSFDEVVVVLFLAGPEQRTIPIQMWSGIREQISPTILAVASMLVAISIAACSGSGEVPMEALAWILVAGVVIGLGIWVQSRWMTRKRPGKDQLDE
jgi:ABC-type spermidine/putrescine transport system permease subunit II